MTYQRRIFSITQVIFGVVLLAMPSGVAVASVLDFDGLGIADSTAIPQSYGDNLPGTPNISVAYRAVDPADNSNTIGPDLLFWSAHYGDLTNVAYGPQNSLAEISLIPEPGYAIQLNDFDLAGYFEADQLNETVRILSQSFAVLADYSPMTVAGAGPAHSSFGPSIFSTGILRIQFSPSFNTGIDNISFDQVRLPEPSSVVLGVCALVSFLTLAWKHRRVAS